MSKLSTPIELTQRQLDYLDKMVEKYGLLDRDKAIRCLINFSCEESQEESRIFEEIRCLDC